MIPTIARTIRHWRGGFLAAVPGGFELVEDVMRGGRWAPENAERLLPMLVAFGFNPDHLSIYEAPACGCCGAYRAADIISHNRNGDWDHALRCERHVDRLPCVVAGCARTFKMTTEDSYRSQVCCGRHWRMAPKRVRDICSLIRRRAKRRGWTDKLVDQHHRFWMRAIRAIEARGDVGGEGHIDLDEIERLFNV